MFCTKKILGNVFFSCNLLLRFWCVAMPLFNCVKWWWMEIRYLLIRWRLATERIGCRVPELDMKPLVWHSNSASSSSFALWMCRLYVPVLWFTNIMYRSWPGISGSYPEIEIVRKELLEMWLIGLDKLISFDLMGCDMGKTLLCNFRNWFWFSIHIWVNKTRFIID